MKYSFKDINKKYVYDENSVLIIASQYSIFNNIVIDRFRDRCKGSLEINLIEFPEEFSWGGNTSKLSDSLTFNEFMNVVKTPAVSGRWFCSVNYNFMTKKQREMLDKYIKKPNKNGMLVVVIEDFMDYRSYLNSRGLADNKNSSIIQLSFPRRDILKLLVSKLFRDRGYEVADKALDLFIMRMSSAYDEYEETIDTICDNVGSKKISLIDMKSAMVGIENYVLDDLLLQLTVPMNSNRISTRRKIYKMMASVTEDLGARKVVNKLKRKLSDIIEMRIIINNGYIPIMIKYSADESKGRLPEGHKFNKLTSFSFKRLAYLASLTSLRDWEIMYIILNNIKDRTKDSEYEADLHHLIHRSVFNSSRLYNIIGIQNIIEESLYDINSILWNLKEVDNGESDSISSI